MLVCGKGNYILSFCTIMSELDRSRQAEFKKHVGEVHTKMDHWIEAIFGQNWQKIVLHPGESFLVAFWWKIVGRTVFRRWHAGIGDVDAGPGAHFAVLSLLAFHND